MKVLICIPCLLTGGTEIQTLNLVKSLIQGKHQVSTVCYFEYLPEMVSRYQEAGSKVTCLSPVGKRIGGMKGIAFLYKGLKQKSPKSLMYSIWLRGLFLSYCYA